MSAYEVCEESNFSLVIFFGIISIMGLLSGINIFYISRMDFDTG
jgi:hypothetical protein